MNDEARQPRQVGSYWNYRVLRQEHGSAAPGRCIEYRMVEAYYENGEPYGYCDAQPRGDSLDELRRALAMMHEALEKPVLNAEAFNDAELPAPNGAKPSPWSPDPKGEA